MSTPVLVPLLNANEPEARLISIHVKDRQPVKKGDLLFTLETTKAAADIESPEAGYARLLAKEGDLLAVGDRLALVTVSADEPLESSDLQPASVAPAASTPAGLRITRPAQALAEQLGIDLSSLPADKLITEITIRKMAEGRQASPQPVSRPVRAAAPNDLVIYGGGGHAKAVMEMALAMGNFRIAGILDDKIPAGTKVLGVEVLGSRDLLPALAESGYRLAANGVGGIVDINVRVILFKLLEDHGFTFPALIHPRCTVEPSANLQDGVQVFANAYVGSSTLLHPRCMVNTGAIISHDCEIGSYTHIAPGALLAGHVRVGERCLVGMGVTTSIGVTIGNGARVGNGAILYANMPEKAIIPTGKVWGG